MQFAERFTYTRKDHFRGILREQKMKARIDSNAERILLEHFDAVSDAWKIVGEGSNFLNFDFLLNKLLQLQGLDILTAPSRSARLFQNERYWADISAYCDWPQEGSLAEWRAARSIQAAWRGCLARRRLQRLKLGREIEHWPGIGVAFKRDLKESMATVASAVGNSSRVSSTKVYYQSI